MTIDKHIYFSLEEYAKIKIYCEENQLSFSKGVKNLILQGIENNTAMLEMEEIKNKLDFICKKLNITHCLLEQVYADLDFENIINPKSSKPLKIFNDKIRGNKISD